MDLFPTFAKLADAKLPEDVEGQDLLPVIRCIKPSVRPVVYLGYRDCMRSVSDGRWKLIRYPLVDRTQLFDLTTDPHELQNLAGRLENAAKQQELVELLSTEMRRYGDTCPLTVNAPAKAEWTPPTQQQLDAEDAAAKSSRKKKDKAPAKK